MTHAGDAFASSSAADPPSAGWVLAERYRLERHVGDDTAGRQVWRGVDIILQRPVAIVLRSPGGKHAEEMLRAAVTASQVTHSNLVGVYDAIDQEDHAFVVREWIDGSALREAALTDGPLDAERTTFILHAVAEAVAALHNSGTTHGNIHPGTVLIGGDGRIVVTDARFDSGNSLEADVRAVGACGYFMLTGQWPGTRPGLPEARRTATGALTAPRQVRAGVPTYLDDLVMDLLNEELTPPSAPVLAAELSRLDTGDQLLFGGTGTLRFADDVPEPTRSPTKLVAVGGTALALVIAGMVLSIKALNANADPSRNGGGSTSQPAVNASPTTANPHSVLLDKNQVRIVDPKGDRTELKNAERIVDGKSDTAWETDGYKNKANFGGSKPGMGVLIKLNQPMHVTSVRVQFTAPGATAELRSGTSDHEDTSAGDKAIQDTYTLVGSPLPKHTGTVMVFPSDLNTQYLLVWITELPYDSATDRYRIGVQEITVEAL
ncbi:MAG TPA: protein kinase family protein [Candidatus Limnocylindrales bacterium]